ncbi:MULTISPECIES: hypothetical protein [Nocardioides]|uniref:Uncharacterized protein n=1 Tax=Nocardioides vastitatis TaxID=2568655 RepID=A0ABW0ZDB0_9ACTN|nr:hypothetical protein [Nocardioides sp.]THJ04022.1 hypothetical protein E7Z54_09165 [Nocardioides sp.]
MRSRAIALLVAALLPLTALGCSPGDDPDPSASDPAASASQTPTTPEPAESGSPSSPETGLPPATGQALELKGSMSFRLPEGGEWHHTGDGSTTLYAGHPVDDGYFDIDASEIETSNTELDPLAKASLDIRHQQAELTPGRFDPFPTRSPNREVSGRAGWVLESTGKKSTFYEFGTNIDGLTAIITFQYPSSYGAGKEWVESILASIEWK